MVSAAEIRFTGLPRGRRDVSECCVCIGSGGMEAEERKCRTSLGGMGSGG
jgi:hypothetical protein